MAYAEALRRLLVGFQPSLEQLYLLEPFQVEQLADRLDPRFMAGMCFVDPTLRRVLVAKHPPLGPYLDDLLGTYSGFGEVDEAHLWEIGELLVYNCAPELYDAAVPGPDLNAIQDIAPLEGVVMDVGAGSGRLALGASRTADVVYAVEPVEAMRRWIRQQALHLGHSNVFVTDGFLHRIPFPDNTADVLITRNALGWRLAEEIIEVDRIIKSDGTAIHLTGLPTSDASDSLDQALTQAGYQCTPYPEGETWCRAYVK
ncbi:MAG: class I SAM-dependent methyltransferase [Myxococcota bacterium]